MAVGNPPAWGIQPSEFWGMCPDEFWFMFDVRRTDPVVAGSSLSQTDLEELYELIK